MRTFSKFVVIHLQVLMICVSAVTQPCAWGHVCGSSPRCQPWLPLPSSLQRVSHTSNHQRSQFTCWLLLLSFDAVCLSCAAATSLCSAWSCICPFLSAASALLLNILLMHCRSTYCVPTQWFELFRELPAHAVQLAHRAVWGGPCAVKSTGDHSDITYGPWAECININS